MRGSGGARYAQAKPLSLARLPSVWRGRGQLWGGGGIDDQAGEISVFFSLLLLPIRRPAEAFQVRAFRNTCHLCPTRYKSASTCSTAVEEGERGEGRGSVGSPSGQVRVDLRHRTGRTKTARGARGGGGGEGTGEFARSIKCTSWRRKTEERSGARAGRVACLPFFFFFFCGVWSVVSASSEVVFVPVGQRRSVSWREANQAICRRKKEESDRVCGREMGCVGLHHPFSGCWAMSYDK